MIKYFVGAMLILGLIPTGINIYRLKLDMPVDNYFCHEQVKRFKSLKSWLNILVCEALFVLDAIFFDNLFGYVADTENAPLIDEILCFLFVLIFCIMLFVNYIIVPFADKEEFTFFRPVIDYIKTYEEIVRCGAKISFKTFKNVFTVCPQNFKFGIETYSFVHNHQEEEFHFDNFLSFLRADLFIGRYKFNLENKAKAKQTKKYNVEVLELMRKAVEDELNKSLNETKVAAQESKNIMKRMSE